MKVLLIRKRVFQTSHLIRKLFISANSNLTSFHLVWFIEIQMTRASKIEIVTYFEIMT